MEANIMEGVIKIYFEGAIKIDKNAMECKHLNGIYDDFARIIGIDNVLKIYAQFKGQQINLPMRLFSQEYVKNEVVRCYDGTNANSLATKFGYSERWVREIVSKNAKKQEGEKVKNGK